MLSVPGGSRLPELALSPERQKEKTARREEAKIRRANAVPNSAGEDPDIAGIVPGPQPNPWGDDELPEDEQEDDETSA